MRKFKHNLPSDPLDFLDEIFCSAKTIYLIEAVNRLDDLDEQDCEKVFNYCADFLKLKSMNHSIRNFKITRNDNSIYKGSFIVQNRSFNITCVLGNSESREVYRLVFERTDSNSDDIPQAA